MQQLHCELKVTTLCDRWMSLSWTISQFSFCRATAWPSAFTQIRCLICNETKHTEQRKATQSLLIPCRGRLIFAVHSIFSLLWELQRARASKHVKNLSQPADVLKIREKQAAFFEANVLITDKPKLYPRMREVCRSLLQIGCTPPCRSGQAICMQVQGWAAHAIAYAAEVYSFQKGLWKKSNNN